MKTEQQEHIESAVKHLLNDDEEAAEKELRNAMLKSSSLSGEAMAADHLVRVDEGIFIGISKEHHGTAVEKTIGRLKKAAEEWRKTSDRVEKLNDQTPYEIQRQAIDRWLTAIETFCGLKDTLENLGVKVVI